MSQNVEIYYLTRWQELEEKAAQMPLCDIDLSPYWASGIAELTFDSFNGFHEFLDECYAISNLCPPLLDQQLMTLFAWKDQVKEFDAPFSRSLRATSSSPWPWGRIDDGLAGAFNPQTVAAWCEVAKSFSWDECEPFFEQARRNSKRAEFEWLSIEGFRAYGQSWLDHYEEARELNAGIVVCHY